MSAARSVTVTRKSEGDPLGFEIVVREGRGETHHRVTMSASDHAKIGGGGASPERCIEAAFAFLLDREPKESILASFDVDVIRRYFPAFDDEVGHYLRTVLSKRV